ncbi:MAG: hypothetical protein Pg6C_16650 [Treponemataceae bacterium]|nr:MAG: hypothetical protein Pg6C_16650 [Treponemataceae bacterium]
MRKNDKQITMSSPLRKFLIFYHSLSYINMDRLIKPSHTIRITNHRKSQKNRAYDAHIGDCRWCSLNANYKNPLQKVLFVKGKMSGRKAAKLAGISETSLRRIWGVSK